MKNGIILILLSSIAITLFLAYIDEGNYDFSWTSDPGSWVAIFLYISLFFLLQFAVLKLLWRKA